MDVTFTQAGIYEVTRTLSNQCFRVSLDFPSCHVLKYKLPQLQCIHIIKQNSNWQNFSKRLSSDCWVVFQLQIWHNVPKQIWSGYHWWVSKTFSFFCSIFRLYSRNCLEIRIDYRPYPNNPNGPSHLRCTFTRV